MGAGTELGENAAVVVDLVAVDDDQSPFSAQKSGHWAGPMFRFEHPWRIRAGGERYGA